MVLSLCVRFVFFGVVLPLFLLYCVSLFSRKLPETFSSCQVRVLEEIFGSELLVLSLGVRLVFFGVVLPLLQPYYLALFSRKLPEKFSSCRVCVLEEIFGSELLVFVLVSGWCFLVLFCLCFSFIILPCSPESCQKNSLLLRCAFWKNISGANFWFFAFVSGWCFLVLFCLCFCFAMLPCSPESFLKMFSSCQVRVFLPLCLVGVFWCCFARFSGCKPMGVVTGLGSPLPLLALSLSLSSWGPARAGALPRCCSSSFSRKAPTSRRALNWLSVALPLAPLPPFAPPLPPRRSRSPLLPAVSFSRFSCLSVFLCPLFLVCLSPLFPSLSVWPLCLFFSSVMLLFVASRCSVLLVLFSFCSSDSSLSLSLPLFLFRCLSQMIGVRESNFTGGPLVPSSFPRVLFRLSFSSPSLSLCLSFSFLLSLAASANYKPMKRVRPQLI